jgi:hypothetical protein
MYGDPAAGHQSEGKMAAPGTARIPAEDAMNEAHGLA